MEIWKDFNENRLNSKVYILYLINFIKNYFLRILFNIYTLLVHSIIYNKENRPATNNNLNLK